MINSLTSLRCVAAVLVFISHLFLFNYFMDLTSGPIYNFFNDLGAMGVSFFFTLSGFVLFINYFPKINKGFQLKKFYIARFARVYPTFFITMMLAVPIELLSERKAFFISSFLSNLFLVQCFHPQTCGTLNSPGWSISSELTFYVLFPLLTLLFLSKPLQHLSMALLLFAAYLIGMLLIFPDSFYAHNGFPLNRLAEFLAGMATGSLYLQSRNSTFIQNILSNIKNRQRLIICLIVLSLGMTLQPLVFQHFPHLHPVFFLYYLVPSCCIIGSLAFLEHAGHAPGILLRPGFLLAGEISYSFYLLHHLIMRYSWHTLRLVFHLDVHKISLLPGLGLSVLMFIISALGAYALYRWVEKPSRHQILQYVSSRTDDQKARKFSPLPLR